MTTPDRLAAESPPDVICSAEDRASEEDALKIFVLSVVKHYPDRPPIHLICPNATAAFEKWTTRFSGVTLDREPLENAYSYNQKPQTFDRLFALGYKKAFWLDDDMVLGPTFKDRVLPKLSASLLAAEEPALSQHPKPDALTRANGWEVGRVLPRVINGGLISISSEHKALIDAWKEILFSDEYRRLQMTPWRERPMHIFGDQEVLTALLGSKRFADIPLAYLKEGDDIVQMFGPAGYSPLARIRNAGRGLPPIVHSMGHKPWRPRDDARPTLRRRYDELHGELSPYVFVAREVVGEDHAAFPWLYRRSVVGGLMRAITMDNPALSGLPLAVFDAAVRCMKRILKIDQMKAG